MYTRWILKDNVHDSEHRLLTKGNNQHLTSNINFNDHHAIPLPPELVAEITSTFLEDPYKIQVSVFRSITAKCNISFSLVYNSSSVEQDIPLQ